MKVVYGLGAMVVPWVLERLPEIDGFGLCQALAILDRKDRPLAGLVFHDYQPRLETIQITMAADSPRWATRNIIRELLSYPFWQLGVQKCWTATPHTNERAIKFNKGIGFAQEAVLERQFGKADAVMCRMFKHEFEELYGQKHTVRAEGP